MELKKEAAQAHLDQARKNFNLHQQLRIEGEHLDWSMTLLFYSALQLTQAYFVETATTAFEIPHGHEQRRESVIRRLPSIWPAYRSLDRGSQVARYQQDRFGDPTDEDVERYLRRDFQPIVEEIESRLGFELEIIM